MFELFYDSNKLFVNIITHPRVPSRYRVLGTYMRPMLASWRHRLSFTRVARTKFGTMTQKRQPKSKKKQKHIASKTGCRLFRGCGKSGCDEEIFSHISSCMCPYCDLWDMNNDGDSFSFTTEQCCDIFCVCLFERIFMWYLWRQESIANISKVYAKKCETIPTSRSKPKAVS